VLNGDAIQKVYRLLVQKTSGLVCNESFDGGNLFEILNKMKLKYGIQASVEELAEKRREIYLDILKSAPLQPKQGVTELLKLLESGRGRLNVRIGYVSSSEKVFLDVIMKQLFQAIGLTSYINDPDAFFCYGTEVLASACWEKGIEKKPSPQLYELAVSKMNLDPAQCIAFEDSLSGCRAALDAGVNLIVIPSSEHFSLTTLSSQYKGRVYQMNSLLDFIPYLQLFSKQVGAIR